MHQGALGDFLLALPVFEGLARLHAGLRLDFWARPAYPALLRGKSYLGQVRSCDSPDLAPFFHEERWKQAPVPPFLEDAAGVLVFGQSLSRTLAAGLAQRLSCRVVWIQSFPDAHSGLPVSCFLIEQVRRAGWPIEDLLPTLEAGAEELARARAWLFKVGWGGPEKPILLHPGSGGKRKIWPLQRWWDTLQWLHREFPNPLILVLGPADECLEDLARAAATLGVEVLSGLSLERLAAFLASSRLFIGNDSGVTHLAASLGTPTIAIFGPTSPVVWAPRAAQVKIVNSQWQVTENLTLDPTRASQAVEAGIQEAIEHALRS
jgi:heptosyltransferase III